jgi:hypothetical protein
VEAAESEQRYVFVRTLTRIAVALLIAAFLGLAYLIALAVEAAFGSSPGRGAAKDHTEDPGRGVS